MYKIQDFPKIKDWSVDAHNPAHVSDANWLRQQVQELNSESETGGRRSILVVTHHAPSMQRTSSPQHERNPWSAAFATELLAQSWDGVKKVWIFGHKHYSMEFVEKGVRVVSNQRG